MGMIAPQPRKTNKRAYSGNYTYLLKEARKRASHLKGQMDTWGDNMEKAGITRLPMYGKVRACALGTGEAIHAILDSVRHLEAARTYLIEERELCSYLLEGELPPPRSSKPANWRFIVHLLYQVQGALEGHARWCKAVEDAIALQRVSLASSAIELAIAKLEAYPVPRAWSAQVYT